jgi:hypothetical protein
MKRVPHLTPSSPPLDFGEGKFCSHAPSTLTKRVSVGVSQLESENCCTLHGFVSLNDS